jgi:hypothetical protein
MNPILDTPTDVETEFASTDEGALVYEWRAEQLARLGISRIVAGAVAMLVD